MNKRGLKLIDVVVILIVILASAGLLAKVTYDLVVKERGALEIETCHLSTFAASIKVGESLTPITCKRNEMVFEIGPNEELTKEHRDTIDKRIGEAITNCIYISGEGKFDWADNAWIASSGGESICIICATIEFGPNLQRELREEGPSYNSFYSWMNVNYVRGGQETHIEYLMRVLNDNKMYIDINDGFKPIYIWQKYAIYSVHLTEAILQKWTAKVGLNPNIDIRIPFTNAHFTTNLGLIKPLAYTYLRQQDMIGGDCTLTMN